MKASIPELQQAGLLPFVTKVYPSSDWQRIIVELRRDPTIAALKQPNILYFAAKEFSVHQLEQAIRKLESP